MSQLYSIYLKSYENPDKCMCLIQIDDDMDIYDYLVELYTGYILKSNVFDKLKMLYFRLNIVMIVNTDFFKFKEDEAKHFAECKKDKTK